MFIYLLLEIGATITAIGALLILVRHILKRPVARAFLRERGVYIPLFVLGIASVVAFLSDRTYAPEFAMPLFMHSDAPGGMAPSISFAHILKFFTQEQRFARVSDIGTDPQQVPAKAQSPDPDGIVRIRLTAQEVLSTIAPDVYLNYWTFNGKVPGPFLRIREGDTVEVSLSNDKTSLHHHTIDLHAVTGPGGGASLSDVAPGETKTFRFKALNPGLYVYHCATPNVSTHNSHGQYGLILVEPSDPAIALSPVDKEFYVMQGEFYTMGQLGKRGLVAFDSNALLAGNPNYVVFNGTVESLPRLHATVGDRIRLYVGNGGVNLVSSFHVIGEIFDTVYPEAAMGVGSSIFKNVQTTAVLPGGATIVEFTVDVPGKYLLVDHALARMNKGAWATLEVTGSQHPEIFAPVP